MGVFSKKSNPDGGGAPPQEDSSRRALFGSRKGGQQQQQQQPAASNPYAQAPGNDPYSQPSQPLPTQQNAYQRPQQPPARQGGYGGGLPSGPKPGAGGGLPSTPRGGNPYGGSSQRSANPYGGMDSGDRYGGGGAAAGGGDRYGGGGAAPAGGDRYGGGSGGGSGESAGGYGANRYGGTSGYGADRYGSGSPAAGAAGGQSSSRRGAGGYGGLGDTGASAADDGSRNALFGAAPDRIAQRQQESANRYAQGGDDGYGQGGGGGGYGQGYGGGYGAEQDNKPFEDRQLTAEEQEEEDVMASKQQIRAIKQEDVGATRNALRLAQQAEETGRDTLARLGAQGEHIHNTEKNLDLSHNQNRLAEEKARELKTLNKSMFAVHVSNPFTAGSRARSRDQAVIDKHVDERERREATRQAAFNSEQRMQRAVADIDSAGGGRAPGQRNLAERAKYQFEADSEDEEMENEIDANLDALGGAASRLNQLARATGRELQEQNDRLDVIAEKSDRVDVGLAANHARLQRFG